MKEGLEFENAQSLAQQFPDTFDAPDLMELELLSEGQHVKVCAAGERFWVLVIDVNKEDVTGLVDNKLIRSDEHFIEEGDEIRFKKHHIYSIL